ncbi:alpha/beta hydrolase [Mycoplasmatota bacterium]|nr:alpha/beta hydrolase [Mycoplasmatota bacterium]
MIFENQKGLRTYYEEYGEKCDPTILLIHGIGADNQMWRPQTELYASKGYHIIVPDMIAHGKSSRVNKLTLSDWTKQIEELLIHLNIHKVSIIGVSMGGVIALSFIVNYPDLVDKIIISDSFGELKTIPERILGFSSVIGYKLFKILGNKALAKGMESTYKADFAYRAKKYFKEICLEVDLKQMVLSRKAINQIAILDELNNHKFNAMVMVGSEFGKWFVKINKKIADSLGTDLIILQNSMDPSNLVNPDEFNKNVLEFLDE